MVHTVEELHSGSFHPASVERCGVGGGALPIRFKPPKMIQSEHVYYRKIHAETVDPPLIARLRHFLPTINGIAPALAGGTEIIGWHAGHDQRVTLLIEVEQVSIGPHLGTVVFHIDGHVSNNAYALLMAVSPQRGPLLEEGILHILAE